MLIFHTPLSISSPQAPAKQVFSGQLVEVHSQSRGSLSWSVLLAHADWDSCGSFGHLIYALGLAMKNIKQKKHHIYSIHAMCSYFTALSNAGSIFPTFSDIHAPVKLGKQSWMLGPCTAHLGLGIFISEDRRRTRWRWWGAGSTRGSGGITQKRRCNRTLEKPENVKCKYNSVLWSSDVQKQHY